MIYHFIQVELNQLVRKRQQLTNKTYFSDITVTNISKIILPTTTWRQKPASIDMERNYATVILRIRVIRLKQRRPSVGAKVSWVCGALNVGDPVRPNIHTSHRPTSSLSAVAN